MVMLHLRLPELLLQLILERVDKDFALGYIWVVCHPMMRHCTLRVRSVTVCSRCRVLLYELDSVIGATLNPSAVDLGCFVLSLVGIHAMKCLVVWCLHRRIRPRVVLGMVSADARGLQGSRM